MLHPGRGRTISVPVSLFAEFRFCTLAEELSGRRAAYADCHRTALQLFMLQGSDVHSFFRPPCRDWERDVSDQAGIVPPFSLPAFLPALIAVAHSREFIPPVLSS